MKICAVSHQLAQFLDLGKKAFPFSGTKEMQHVIQRSPYRGAAAIREYNEELLSVGNLSRTIQCDCLL